MFQIHPLIAHLPVGLFLGAGLLSLLGLFFKRGLFKEILVWIIALGVLSTIPNIYTGLKESQNVFLDSNTIELMNLHKRNAYVMLVFFVFLFGWLLIRRRKMSFSEYFIFFIFIIFGCSSVIYESITGYQLVFEHGANVAKSCPSEPSVDKGSPENVSLFRF